MKVLPDVQQKTAGRCRPAVSGVGGPSLDGLDVDAPPLAVEVDCAGGQGEEGVVAAEADVAAGVEAGAALADDDAAGLDRLAAEDLHAEALAVRLAAVAAGTLTL